MKIGIDLGGSHLGLGVIDKENNLIERFEKDFTQEDKKDIINVIENYIVDNVKKLEQKYEIENIGIAVPGNSKNGVILKTVNLGINNYNIVKSLEEKIKKHNITKILEEQTNNYSIAKSLEEQTNNDSIAKSLEEKINIPIIVRNDAKCACLAEYENMKKNNTIRKDANVVFLSIGTGIGGGVIYNGTLLEGHFFEGYEIGHMVIKENGIPCKCGKSGCFERYGSILEYKNKVKQRLNIPQEINGNELREIIDKHKSEIEDIDNQYIEDLAIGISNLINIFEPDTVVLGGGFSHFSYMFKEKLENRLINSNLLFNKRDKLDLRIAELGNDAGIIGAVITN